MLTGGKNRRRTCNKKFWGCCLASFVRLVVYGALALFLLWLAAFLILTDATSPFDVQKLYGAYRAELGDIRKELVLSKDMTYRRTIWYGGVGTNWESGTWGFIPDNQELHLRMTNRHVVAESGWNPGNAPREFEWREYTGGFAWVYGAASFPFGLVCIDFAFGEQEMGYWKIRTDGEKGE